MVGVKFFYSELGGGYHRKRYNYMRNKRGVLSFKVRDDVHSSE